MNFPIMQKCSLWFKWIFKKINNCRSVGAVGIFELNVFRIDFVIKTQAIKNMKINVKGHTSKPMIS